MVSRSGKKNATGSLLHSDYYTLCMFEVDNVVGATPQKVGLKYKMKHNAGIIVFMLYV